MRKAQINVQQSLNNNGGHNNRFNSFYQFVCSLDDIDSGDIFIYQREDMLFA